MLVASLFFSLIIISRLWNWRPAVAVCSRKYVQVFLLLLLAVLFVPGAVHARPVEIESGNKSVQYLNQSRIEFLYPYIQYIKDESRQLTAAQILEQQHELPWETSSDQYMSIGSTTDIYWFKLSIDHLSFHNQTVFLGVDHALLYDMTVFVYAEGNLQSQFNVGVGRPYFDRDIYTNWFTIPLELAPRERYQILFRVDARTYLDFPARLLSDTQIINEYSEKWLIDGLYYGMIVVMVLFNLFIYFSTKDKSYAFYVCFISFIGLTIATIEGSSFHYLWPNLPAFNQYALYLFASLVVFFGSCFTLSFLKLHDHIKWMHNYLACLAGVSLLLFLCAGVFGNLTLPAIGLLVMIAFPSYFFIGCIAWYRGLNYAKYFSLAWAVMCLFAAIIGLALLGAPVFPMERIWMLLRIGSALEMVLLAFALAERISILRRESEDFRELALEASESNLKLKNEFLSTITHELLTPMHGIIGGIDALEDGKSLQQINKIDHIKDSADNMMQLIDRILVYTRMYHDQLHLEKKSLQLSRVLDEIEKHYRKICCSNGIVLRWQVAGGLPEWVEMDEQNLQSIIGTLLDNAVKFTSEGTIECSVGWNENVCELVISIKDTGIGIKQDKQRSIFDAFKQSDTGLQRRFGGLGIGLSICFNLVKAHNGMLQVESTIGEGSCFTVTIPVTKLFRDNPSVPSLANPQLPLLIVDDIKVNRLILGKMLKKLGYRYEMATNGKEALQKIELEAFSVVLMDLQMPVMSGIECTEIIRQRDDKIADIPIIAVTANACETHTKEAGMNDFLKKPFTINVLRECLSSYIGPSQIVDS